VLEGKCGRKGVWAANLHHRGDAIRQRLADRRTLRRGRRNRKTRYRAPRFANRTWPAGWLPPSLKSRVDHVRTWAGKLIQRTPVSALAVETARFDTQASQTPEISGVTGEAVSLNAVAATTVSATGRGKRQVVRTDRYGFPRGGAGRIKRVFGFQTGDLVRLVQPQGKYAGTWTGRLAGIRADGRLDIQTARGKVTAHASHFHLLQHGDGYAYAQRRGPLFRRPAHALGPARGLFDIHVS
jgi:hypothetical protein